VSGAGSASEAARLALAGLLLAAAVTPVAEVAAADAAVAEAAVAEAAVAEAAVAEAAVAEAAVADSGVLADPTRPLATRAGPAAAVAAAGNERPLLSSVLIGERRRLAVIDGRTMQEGETHDGVEVRRIRPRAVVVSVNGAPPVVLELPGSSLRKEQR
jgi:hypothetical protein